MIPAPGITEILNLVYSSRVIPCLQPAPFLPLTPHVLHLRALFLSRQNQGIRVVTYDDLANATAAHGALGAALAPRLGRTVAVNFCALVPPKVSRRFISRRGVMGESSIFWRKLF